MELEPRLGLFPRRSAVVLENAPGDLVIRVGTGDIDALALALDELLDLGGIMDRETAIDSAVKATWV